MRAERIMGALEELLLREASVARSGSGLKVRAIQARIAPLVAALSEISRTQGGPKFTAGLAALAEKRRANREIMQRAAAGIKAKIEERAASIGRLRKIHPVYAAEPMSARRLNVSS